jgi:hypothetical protein
MDSPITMLDGWLPIEHAPKHKIIRAKIWHADRYYEVDARWASGPRFWADVDPHSCVGWKEGVSKPAFYREAESNV